MRFGRVLTGVLPPTDEELPGQKTEEPEQIEEPEPVPVASVQRASGPRPRPSPAIRPWDVGKEGVPGEWTRTRGQDTPLAV